MRHYTLTHLGDAVLLRRLSRLVALDRRTTAALLAHIAEVDARRLYAPAGYSSMHAYCVGELRLSEDAASKRIQAARAARRVPALFEALADGRLHLTAVRLLAPHITPENAGELIGAATHRRNEEIELLLLRRVSSLLDRHQAQPLLRGGDAVLGATAEEHAPGHVPHGAAFDEHAPGHVEPSGDEIPAALSERFLLRIAVSSETREKLRYAQALLSHALPTGDVGQVLDRALDLLITSLEKRKFGGGTSGARRPAPARGSTPVSAPTQARGNRYLPAAVRRAVWERDHGRCTFVASNGTRCEARRFLEFDHVEPVARGGRASVEGLRLRCRAHNQYEAERAFGRDFMNRKRDEARRARESVRERTVEVQHCLRRLGCRTEEARRAAELTEAMRGAPLEERLRAALRSLGTKAVTTRAAYSP